MTFSDNDVARVTCGMDIGGILVESTWHVRNLGAGALSDAAAITEIAARVDSAYDTIKALLSTSYGFNTITVFNVTQDAPMGLVGWPTLIAGTSGADEMPPAVAYNVLFSTLTARSQGRKFLGPFTTTARGSTGNPASALITAGANFRAAILAPWLVSSGSFQFGNWRGASEPGGPLFSPWTGSKNGSYFRTMRRRYPDAGP